MNITSAQIFTNGPVRCPSCRVPGQSHPGYIVNGESVKRCEVCKGHGHTTATNATAYLDGCVF